MKYKHGERKVKNKRRHRDRENESDPPRQGPGNMMNNGLGGAMAGMMGEYYI